MARFVLVHGAFHGAWCWEPLVAELSGAFGHAVDGVRPARHGDDETPVPTSRSTPTRAHLRRAGRGARARRARRPQHGRRRGHAGRGALPGADRAACLRRRVSPGDGQSLSTSPSCPEGAGDMVQENMVVEGDPPVATMPAEAAREAFYGRCSPQQAEWALEQLRPQPLAPFVTPVEPRRRERAPAARVRRLDRGPRDPDRAAAPASSPTTRTSTRSSSSPTTRRSSPRRPGSPPRSTASPVRP